MPITNAQYENLLSGYSARRLAALAERDRRLEQIRRDIPEYAALEDESTDVAVSFAKRYIEDPSISLDKMDEGLRDLADRRRRLLREHGYSDDYLEPPYTCPDCEDTGFIDGQKCHCLIQKELEIMYDSSNLREMLKEENWDTLREDIFEGEDLEHFRGAVSISHNFVDSFDSTYTNLMFYGTVGTGKSFLCSCIAGDLLASGHSVIYLSAADFFKAYGDMMYGKKGNEEKDTALMSSELFSCDLLVIDDLGTEMAGQFTNSALFHCMNTRHTRHKSTIINTNLSLRELQDRYSDRVFTRLTGFYRVLKLTGPDLRLRRRA